MATAERDRALKLRLVDLGIPNGHVAGVYYDASSYHDTDPWRSSLRTQSLCIGRKRHKTCLGATHRLLTAIAAHGDYIKKNRFRLTKCVFVDRVEIDTLLEMAVDAAPDPGATHEPAPGSGATSDIRSAKRKWKFEILRRFAPDKLSKYESLERYATEIAQFLNSDF